MRYLISRATLAVVMLSALPVLADRQQPESLERIMALKLQTAQGLLRSIVLEDYAALARQARELGRLTQTEAWGVLRTPDYARQSNEFLRATEYLEAAAGEGQIDSAALEYVNVTLKCVQCHKAVRSTRRALLGTPPEEVIGAPGAIR